MKNCGIGRLRRQSRRPELGAHGKQLGELTVYDRRRPAPIIERIGDASWCSPTKPLCPAKIFDACPGLKFVGVLATGYNIIDIAAAKEHGVVVCNIPGYSTDAVAQMTWPCCWRSATTWPTTVPRFSPPLVRLR